MHAAWWGPLLSCRGQLRAVLQAPSALLQPHCLPRPGLAPPAPTCTCTCTTCSQIRPPDAASASEMYAHGREPNAGEKHGLVYCRGAEVVEVRDEQGK